MTFLLDASFIRIQYCSYITNKFGGGGGGKFSLMQSVDQIDILEVHGDALVHSCFGMLYNLLVELDIDKGLVWIRLSCEALLLPVLTCDILFPE